MLFQFKIDCTKNDIRRVVADLPMDKNYKIVIKDFSRTPILSDDVFKAMDKNNDGEVSKVSICIILFAHFEGYCSIALTLFGFTSFREDIMRIFLGRAEIGQEGLDDEADTVNHVKTGQ